jgi:hypothetical protein
MPAVPDDGVAVPNGSHPGHGGGRGGRCDARLRGDGQREDGVTPVKPARQSSTTGIATQAMRRPPETAKRPPSQHDVSTVPRLDGH